MNNQYIIKTERLILRTFQLSDAKRVQELAGNPKISKTAVNVPYPYKDGMAEEWIATHEKEFKEDKSLIYAIVKEDRDELIGSISLTIDRGNLKAELGYWIGVPYWSKGYGREAAKAIVEFGFGKLDLNKIHAKAFTTNQASCTLLESIGMEYEASLREEIIYNGIPIDLKRYAILKKDFMKSRKVAKVKKND